ncbi:ATPase [cyanobacterium TDX16]|nr:ATPase [cyanobacterium TDX16]
MEKAVEKPLEKEQELFPIVGIGASAGGLTAFTQLLEHLPSDTGMGFVLVQHLARDRKSLLPDLLAQVCQMPVTEVQDGISVEPNHVYIIPPNRKMTLAQGKLRLAPRENISGKHMPVDALFYSLAQELSDKAIGVVLSGGDGDGALGLKAIQAAGGITFAQCEASAQVSSMPHHAATINHLDFILPPQEIAKELAKISVHPYVKHFKPTEITQILVDAKDSIQQIFAMLRTVAGIDFTNYKRPTLLRRLKRRLVLHKIETLEDYVKYLQAHPIEIEALSQEFLIHVTSFFRDPEVFQALKTQVFPRITPDKSLSKPIRIWIPGCSTGEEVYSIAICLLEFLSELVTKPTIQLFGTDISELAIQKARLGTYAPSLVNHVSPERLRRFFIKVDGEYQIVKKIREMCVFAKQDLGADPPFSNLDLISCRNVFIYLEKVLQQRVIPLFHYSLKPTGFLLLGTSESTGGFSELFSVVDKKHKIYAKKLAPTQLKFNFVERSYLTEKLNSKKMSENSVEGFDLVEKQADRIVWSDYTPVGVVIDSNLDIRQFRGETSPYLKPASGKPSFNLLTMAETSLRSELNAAILQAKQQNVAVKKSGIQLVDRKQLRLVSFDVIPFKVPPTDDRYFLIFFRDTPASADGRSTDDSRAVSRGGKQTSARQEANQLKQELAATQQELAVTKENLQSIVQEYEATNQDLVTANEEVLSSNEELQSINEELETAKEEIQATNEELTTTNEELRSRILESNQLSNDLRNLLGSINIPIVMVGRDLLIRRFTPTAEEIFNLIPTDLGRPLNHINPNINLPNLEQSILEVIDTLIIKEQEVQDEEGRWYNLMIRPYQTTEGQIDGAVILLVNIDALKRNAQILKQARDYAEAIVETVREPLVILDANLQVVTANQSFYQTFQVSPAQTENRSIFALGNGQWDIPQLRSHLEEILSQNNQLDNFEVEYDFEQIGRKTMLLNARKISPANDNTTNINPKILLAIEDITERKLFEQQRTRLLTNEQSLRAEAEAASQTKDQFLSIVSHELRNPLNSMLGWSQLLRRRKFDAAQTVRALETIEKSAKSQVKLVEDLLDISSIIAGKLRLNTSSIALASAIDAAIAIVRLSADAKNIQLEFQDDSEPVMVLGDAERLEQIVWNLLSNAIKFTPSGGRIIVKLDQIDSLAQIQVCDTGQGISADFLPYVFERFRQADSSKTRAQGGLGLGLSIVRQLVELHGGTVHAASPGVGQGTTMTVRLPLLPAKNSPASNLDRVDSTVQQVVPSDSIQLLEGLQVLVVDDDTSVLELLRTILEDYGVLVTAVVSVEEAIAALRANPGQYDVLLSDIGMPNEDGYSLIRRVRALSADLGGQIPAAALTAYVTDKEQRESLGAGFQKHIIKPVEPEQLAAIVAELAALRPT